MGADDCVPEDNLDDERMERGTEFACGLADVRKKATENLSAPQDQQKSRYDVKHAPPTYKVGDTVLKYNRRRDTRMGDKLQPRYTGPFKIAEVLGRGVYRLKDGDAELKQAVNATNLKLWVDHSPPSTPSKRQGNNSQSPSPPRKTSSAAVKSNTSIDDCGQQNVVDLTAPASTPLQIHVPQTPWVPSLNLSTADKSIILDGEWLNDKIVDAANRIVAAHLGLSAPQTSLLAQSSEGFTSLRADDTSMQILYDAAHWITAECVDGEVYVANSLGNNDISPPLAKQLKQLYATCSSVDGSMEVTLIACAQQPNDSDCGVFATAFLFEWASASVRTSLVVRFDLAKMRPHLVLCLEANRLPVTRRGKGADVRKITI